MQTASVFYLGTDPEFSAILAEAAQKAGYEYAQHKLAPKALDTPDLPPTVVILDCHCPQALLDDHRHAPGNVLLVLVVDQMRRDWSAVSHELWERCDDVLVKDMDPRLLDKKLRWYFDVLRGSTTGQNSRTDALIKETHHLNEQIHHLEQQYSQADLDRRTQQEVIERINHISELSRQINCLDQERIASVCIEALPALISGTICVALRIGSR